MADFLDIVLRGLGQGFYFLYNTIGFHNFGLTIIFFTLIIKVVLMPLTMKSQKSTSEMNALQPEVKKIQERYKNDKEKQNQEIQKLYKENNVSCMGGCLPMLFQFPILIALYSVLRRPLTLVVGKSAEAVMKIANNLPQELKEFVLYSSKTEVIEKVTAINELKLIDVLSNNPQYLDNAVTGADLINLNFLGLNLGKVPSINPSVIFGPEMGTYPPLLLVPIVALIMTIISQKLMTPPKVEEKKDDKDKKNPMGGMSNMMKYMIPGMTLYFSFILPASMGLYWTCTYAFQIFQQLLLNKRKKDKEEAEKGNTGASQKPGGKKKLDGGKK